jgi:agmatine deiminase
LAEELAGSSHSGRSAAAAFPDFRREIAVNRLASPAVFLLLVLSTPVTTPSIGLAQSIAARPAAGWLFPGEYESHEAMWMLWPTYVNKAGFPSTEVVSDMIQAMSGHVHVNLAVQDADDEAAARRFMTRRGVPLGHVDFFHIPHLDLWARDMGPQFTRNLLGQLRVNDWNFSYWGYEDVDSESSVFEESFDRTAASLISVPTLDSRPGPTGVRMVHEGGSATHNGRGTMIVVESVVMQRNLGPNRFCGGQAPVTDYSQPNTYAPNPDWPACKALVEREYRRMLGVKKFIWVPTGVIEDNGTFRGALGTHIRVTNFNGIDIPHAGVYTMFTTNGHPDEYLRFVSPDTVVLAQASVPTRRGRTPAEELVRWIEEQNHERLERIRDILSTETTESGRPIEIVRIPTPELMLDVIGPGDGTYDYFVGYDRWEDGSTTPEVMLTVWPASYVNYVPTNDLVLVSKFWKPGRAFEIKRKDDAAREILEELFPGRAIVQVYSENVNRGGGGMNCITQQQPASARFAQTCGWAKVKVGVRAATLFAGPRGDAALGDVPRLTDSGRDVYLRRLSSSANRVEVRVAGAIGLDGVIGWVDEQAIESAGEKCPSIH